MAGRWTRKRMTWTIIITVILTVLTAAIAMNFATPEKKLERIIPHRYSVDDPQFRREMGVMLVPAIVSGNKVEALQNGDEIFPAMLAAIRSAKKTITFETYIYWSGYVGKEFADALSERAKAGVKVNVTIDWAGSISMKHRAEDIVAAARGVRDVRNEIRVDPGNASFGRRGEAIRSGRDQLGSGFSSSERPDTLWDNPSRDSNWPGH